MTPTTVADNFTAELDRESRAARRPLERVPEGDGTTTRPILRGAALTLLVVVACAAAAQAEVRSLGTGAFEIFKELVVPGEPEAVYDAFTLETFQWWDHFHSESPKALYFEPRPGGGFVEIFDDQGNGALHATVIYADRGRLFRWSGPMGFNGYGLEMNHSLAFDRADQPGYTRLRLTVRCVGQLKEDWPVALEGVWDHFLVERFRPYLEAKAAATEEP